MREIGFVVRGFLTVRRDSLRVPLSGSLTVNADPDSGLFSGTSRSANPPSAGRSWVPASSALPSRSRPSPRHRQSRPRGPDIRGGHGRRSPG